MLVAVSKGIWAVKLCTNKIKTVVVVGVTYWVKVV